MEEIEHIKKLLDMCKDDDGEYDFVQINITCEDLTAIEHLIKIINDMAEQLVGLTIWDNEKEEPVILTQEKEVLDFFRKRVR